MNSSADKPDTVRRFEVTHASVLRLAMPMTIAYITTPLLGIVDTAVVGQFGVPAMIGGLAIGAVFIDLIFTTFNFLRSGTTGLVAQAVGAEDEKEKQAILFRALAIAILAGMIFGVASPLLLKFGLWFMAPSPAVAEAASTYFLIRMIAAPVSLGNYVILGWLFGLGKSTTTLAIQLLINVTNMILSIVLGLWFGWEVTGVAIATIIGETIGFIVGGYLCWRLLDRTTRPSRKSIFKLQSWKRLANLNVDIMIRSFALLFAFAFFTAQGAKFGEVTLAANALLMHFFFIGANFLDGMVAAVEQIVGRAVGANYRAGFWKGFWYALFWGAVMAIGCALVFWLTGETIIHLMTTSDVVREEAATYLIWAAIIPLTGLLAFHLDSVFIGATWTRDMSIMMLFSLVIYVLAWELLKEPMGNHGLWLALNAFLVLRGLTLAIRVHPRVKRTFPSAAR
ncbi:MAG: MATE family efflux transporter [Pseudomonadota bacterium]